MGAETRSNPFPGFGGSICGRAKASFYDPSTRSSVLLKPIASRKLIAIPRAHIINSEPREKLRQPVLVFQKLISCFVPLGVIFHSRLSRDQNNLDNCQRDVGFDDILEIGIAVRCE